MDENTLLDFDYPTKTAPSIIKVIGVGGGGGNAVRHMYKEGIHNVTFALCNTDNQALMNNDVPVKIQLGRTVTEGLGAGGKPEIAKKAAEESTEDIKNLLDDGTKMVFITAGMGGGTGTGAGPIIAQIAREKGILTVGIITIPFGFEGEKKILQALHGAEEMRKNVDALVVVNNERLFNNYLNLSTRAAYAKVDDTVNIAAKSIAEIITLSGHINTDFADVETTMKNGGIAIVSSGMGAGENRIAKAIENTLNSPLVNNHNIFNAKKILWNISSSETTPILIEEMLEIKNFMAKFNTKDIEVIWGESTIESLNENIKFTIIATGFELDNVPMDERYRKEWKELSKEEEEKRKSDEKLMEEYGYKKIIGKKIHPKPFIFTLEQLDDDNIIDIVINNPAYNRSSSVFRKNEKIEHGYTNDHGAVVSNPENKNPKNIITF